ncbi:hypothetical protein AGR6A_Cc120088 [Agrobacterium sp. NCPPB 925]|nr:hypothetical protein AGR6A_Cc120088 [Agrobacterium sp. NCPPB 925]
MTANCRQVRSPARRLISTWIGHVSAQTSDIRIHCVKRGHGWHSSGHGRFCCGAKKIPKKMGEFNPILDKLILACGIFISG